MNEVSSPAESADEPILQCPTCRSQLSLNSEVSELDEKLPLLSCENQSARFPAPLPGAGRKVGPPIE